MKTRIVDRGYGEKEVTAYVTEHPDQVASFALEMLRHSGLTAGVDAGEDSAGRAKIKLVNVGETVERAFDIAAEAFRVARARGLLVQMPDLNEVNAEYDAARGEERTADERRKSAKLAASNS